MPCIKTGCQLFLEPYGEYAYGDAFRLGDVYYFRIVEVSRDKIRGDEVHYLVNDWDSWFDRDGAGASTMISNKVMTA